MITYMLEYRDDDYRFFSDSVNADTLEEAIQKARKRMKDHVTIECTIYKPVAYLDKHDSECKIEENK